MDQHPQYDTRINLRWPNLGEPQEAEYRARLEPIARRWRLVLGSAVLTSIVGFLILCCGPIAPPADVLRLTRLLLVGAMIPATVLSMVSCVWHRLYDWSVSTCVGSTLINAASVMILRVAYAHANYDIVPLEMLIALLLVLIAAYLPMSTLVRSIVPGLIGGIATEFWAFGINVHTLLETGTMSAILFVQLGVVFEYKRMLRIDWSRERYLDHLACIDSLTNVANRRHFDLTFRRLIRAAAREHCDVALMVLDVDHFKSYNDHYGHPAGDDCLRAIGHHLGNAARRPHDFAARLGGEEFAVVFFNSDPGEAIRMSESLRRGIAELGIEPSPGRGTAVTASAGFIQIAAPQADDDADRVAIEMLRRCDKALYEAKASGRDSLCVAQWLTGAQGAHESHS